MNIPFLFFFRHVPTLVTLLALILAVSAGCSSDDDGDVVDIPGTIPNLLNYEIRQNTGVSMTLSQNPAATVTSALLTGTFNRITEAFTLNVQPAVMAVSAGDFLSQLDIDLNNTNFSDYSLHVTMASAWVGDGNPTSGEFDIFDDAVRKITMSVISDVKNTGLPGVLITYFPDGASFPGTSVSDSFTWEQLDGLFDDTNAEAYTRIASFAYSMLRFMYEQGGLVILALEFLGDNDATLEQIGQIVDTCDTFPRPADDPTVINPGTSAVSWSDANGDNELGPGDTFFLDFIDCWDDDVTDTIDTLIDGTINFVNYTEVQTGGVITRVGFEPTGGPGGIDFTSTRITETEDDGVMNILIVSNETISLSGGFSMVFTAP